MIMKRNILQEDIVRIKDLMLIKESANQQTLDTLTNELDIPPMTQIEADAIAGCDDDEVPNNDPTMEQTLTSFKKAVDLATPNVLKNAFKQLRQAIRNAKKNKNVQKEQVEAAAVTILGVPLGTAALIVIGALLLLKIIGKLLRGSGGGGGGSQGCRAGQSDIRREFGKKIM